MDKTSIGRAIPINIERGPRDATDGNSNSGGMFSGHQQQFHSGQGSVKNWLGQDYKSLKRDCKARGMLFEDPQFPASNHLLVDDNNQFIISYFGRTRFDQNSIEWLRPHEICQKMNTSLRPKMFVAETT